MRGIFRERGRVIGPGQRERKEIYWLWQEGVFCFFSRQKEGARWVENTKTHTISPVDVHTQSL